MSTFKLTPIHMLFSAVDRDMWINVVNKVSFDFDHEKFPNFKCVDEFFQLSTPHNEIIGPKRK